MDPLLSDVISQMEFVSFQKSIVLDTSIYNCLKAGEITKITLACDIDCGCRPQSVKYGSTGPDNNREEIFDFIREN
ncbi:hypothetical protein KIN20_033957 [Parelaphostrongylus tenuis]|uniref:Uncharacterized protein n=1 Tax=Parelaphostrongylus tenuis TaxID=148309 RepID=A0AAD5WIW2_PARTN|nr:hypothetical protein KIN20_033957 [Parelaphostrongylus tenuis]